MKTKILGILLAILLVVSVFAMTSCDLSTLEGLLGEQGEKGETGEQGPQGEKGETGATGVGIEKLEYNSDGNLVITYTDGTTQTIITPENQHTHTFGEWINHNELSSCEKQLYYRICSGCSDIEWRSGLYEDHDFETVTTSPTCQAGGFDTKTCKNCGLVEIVNETPVADHDYSETYENDNSFHWNVCVNCDATTEKTEHTLGDDGICTVCDAVVGATEGLIYDLSSDGTYAALVAYEGTATRIRIAEEYMGAPVTIIGDNVFRSNKNITSVIIPDSVTSIGFAAFSSCDSLTSVVIGDSVTSIGNNAFTNCSSLTSVVIPDSVTSIGYGAFRDCSSLTSVVIPDSVTYIDNGAFNGCNSALYTEYKYGKYVKSGDNPYAVMIWLTNENFSTYEIHEDTKIIAYGVFHGCSLLSSITIPDSVTSIGEYAFRGCSNLTSVVIGDNVTSIGDSAFSSCSNLTSVVIPNSVTSIGESAFYGCDNLTSVVIGDSVTSIGYSAFISCSSLTDVYYTGTAEEWGEITIESGNYYLTGATIHYNYVPEE